MSENESWTIGRLLRWTADYLSQHGSSSGRLDAEVLLSHARGCERIELYTAFDEVPAEDQRAKFRELVRRRAEGVPVAYLVGHREFFSLPFYVSPAVLIPRPETESLVIAVQDLVRQAEALDAAPRRWEIVDVGTGCGIIGICLAKQLPNALVRATDISQEALDIAAKNCQRHEVVDRVQLIQGSLLEPLAAEPTFDFVVSNPPYVSEPEYAELDPTVKNFEPQIALVGGATGSEIIDQLVEQAIPRLKPSGWLLMEISPMIESRVLDIIHGTDAFDEIKSSTDSAGWARVVLARRR
jgi:release factor glutamine methyltransferase